MELYQEIVQNEASRIDLFKWKIILVAGLGAAASGLLGKQPISPILPLALIPLVCLYVDFLCLDLTLRIVAISKYLNLVHRREENKNPSDIEYATFVVEAADQMVAPTFCATACKIGAGALNWIKRRPAGTSAYVFIFLAQGLSTSALSLGVFLWGYFLPKRTNYHWVLAVAAFIGIAATAWSYVEYKRRTMAIEAIGSLPNR